MAGYEIIQENGYLRIAAASDVSWADMMAAYQEVGALDRDRNQPRLWVLPADMTRDAIEEFTFERLEALASEGVSQHVGGPAAVVAPVDAVFGKARQVTLLRPDQSERFRVFRSEDEAVAWLAAPDEGDA